MLHAGRLLGAAFKLSDSRKGSSLHLSILCQSGLVFCQQDWCLTEALRAFPSWGELGISSTLSWEAAVARDWQMAALDEVEPHDHSVMFPH